MELRDVKEEDLEIFFAHQREPDANRMAAFPPREREAFFVHWRTKIIGNPAAVKKTIVADGVVAGNIGSWADDGKRFVGYWIGSAYWGRGIATAALRDFVARHETQRPLCAHVAVENIGSIRVLEKCGLQRVGAAEAGPDGVAELLMQLRA